MVYRKPETSQLCVKRSDIKNNILSKHSRRRKVKKKSGIIGKNLNSFILFRVFSENMQIQGTTISAGLRGRPYFALTTLIEIRTKRCKHFYTPNRYCFIGLILVGILENFATVRRTLLSLPIEKSKKARCQ